GEPPDTDGRPPPRQVPQAEQGLPLTAWPKRNVELAERPDGSRVPIDRNDGNASQGQAPAERDGRPSSPSITVSHVGADGNVSRVGDLDGSGWTPAREPDETDVSRDGGDDAVRDEAQPESDTADVVGDVPARD